MGKVGDNHISIDWETKTIDIEADHYIFIEFEDLEDVIKILEKIKIKIKEEVKVNE